jgi:hypothetical protein
MSEGIILSSTQKIQIGFHEAYVNRLEKILDHARNADKPNFTQYQLKLSEIDADKHWFTELRNIMEKKYNLPSLDHL